MAKVQIINGNFQDSNGNLLALGNLQLELSQDEQVSGVGQICAKRIVTVPLDVNGNVSGTVLMWPNDQMVPTNSYYLVKGYNAQGQLVWGPNAQQILGASPFDLNTWIPNYLPNFFPATSVPTLQTNGVNNGSQLKLNLKNGSNVTVTDDGSGGVTIAATIPAVTSLTTAKVSHQATVNTTVAPGSPSPTSWGLMSLQNSATSQSIIPPTATSPNLWSQVSQNAANQGASFWYETPALVTSGILGTWLSRIGFSQGGVAVSNAVLWLGLTDTIPAGFGSTYNSATPTANIVGFRFVTGTDTHWMAVCQTDATHQTLVDTGVTPDAGTHVFGIQKSSGTYGFYIDGVLKASITTNVPVGTLGLFSFQYSNNTQIGAITTNTSSVYWDSGF